MSDLSLAATRSASSLARPGAGELPAATVEAVADTFRSLGDPTRVRILALLADEELCVCDVAARTGVSESAVSHQLRLLRGARLVRPRRAGRHVFYALDDQHILGLLRLAAAHVEEPGAGPARARNARR
jgi:DNA-binding transcriptional ArsR family regulator